MFSKALYNKEELNPNEEVVWNMVVSVAKDSGLPERFVLAKMLSMGSVCLTYETLLAHIN